MAELRKQYPFQQMTEYLESMIAAGVFRPGDKLPPLRELGERFSLNLDTVRRGIWHLRDRGLLECRRSSGVFVGEARDGAPKQYRIGAMLRSADPGKSYCAHVLLGIQKAALARNVLLEVRPAAGEPHETVEISASQAERCDALILLGNYDAALRELALPCPAVGVEMHRMYGGVLSTIAIDPINAAEIAAEYFRARGVREVRVVGHAAPVHDFRAEQFLRLWPGARYERIPLHTERDWQYETLRPEEGLLFTGGDSAQLYARLWREFAGGVLADDFHVLSIDGKSLVLPGFDPVDCIAVDWLEVGRRALDEALRRIVTPGAAANRIYLDVKLHLRNEK